MLQKLKHLLQRLRPKIQELKQHAETIGHELNDEILHQAQELKAKLPQPEVVSHKLHTLADAYSDAIVKVQIEQADSQFIGDTSISTLQGPSYFSRIILWTALAFFLIAIIWAKLAILDEMTTGDGKVIPSSQIQVIQNLEGGIIQKILVHEGDTVQKGQILMLIDDTRFASDYREGQLKAASLQAKIARLTAEANGTSFMVTPAFQKEHPDLVKNEEALYLSRKSEQQNKIDAVNKELIQKQQDLAALIAKKEQLQRSYDLSLKELNLTKPLVAEGAASQVEVIRLERQFNDLSGEIAANAAAIPEAHAAIAETQSKLNNVASSFRSQVLDDLTTAKNQLDGVLQANHALQDRVARTSVRSPVRGIVKLIKYATIGGVVQPGSEMMEIVPLDDSLLIEAKIRPADIGFIHPGQQATVKITAYDFSIYGGLPAVVEQISADSISEQNDGRTETFYQIRVRTERNYLGPKEHPLPIIPGMQATVNILTGHKSVLDYMLKPLLKTRYNAMHER